MPRVTASRNLGFVSHGVGVLTGFTADRLSEAYDALDRRVGVAEGDEGRVGEDVGVLRVHVEQVHFVAGHASVERPVFGDDAHFWNGRHDSILRDGGRRQNEAERKLQELGTSWHSSEFTKR